MENIIGDWALVPELTTGHDEFAEAMGMTEEESALTSCEYTFHLSRDGSGWRMKVSLGELGTLFDSKFQPNVAFNYMLPDQATKMTVVASEKNGHLVEKLTSENGSEITKWDVDTYPDGDFLMRVETKDGISKTQTLRRL
ncbi:uncharacterized protein [Haliotis asinina]|uniref:uncharacterized protein n=1 Tax=Haliotis asinina TaxID=109174 RepID=UPI0035324264